MLTFPQAQLLRQFCDCGPYKVYELERANGTFWRLLQRLVDKSLITQINRDEKFSEVSATELGLETNAQLRRWDNPDDAPEWTQETFDRAMAGSPSRTTPPT